MSDRLMAITTDEYKSLAQKSIRADLLWQKCERIRKQTGEATIEIDEVGFILGMNDSKKVVYTVFNPDLSFE